MEHQDWKTVVLKNLNKPLNQPKNIIRKDEIPKSSINPSVKLNENDEVTNIKYVPKDVANLIVQGRQIKKLTRKDLAKNLNLKEDVIANIEMGKAIYDGNQIAKIKKYLGI